MIIFVSNTSWKGFYSSELCFNLIRIKVLDSLFSFVERAKMSCVLMTILILYPSLIALKQQDRYTCFRSLCLFLPHLPERGKDTFSDIL